MFVESMLFQALFVIMLLLVGGNALTMKWHGSYFCSISFGIGRSMEPALPGGVTAYFVYYPRTIELGDIAIFRSDDMFICHRVVEIDGDYIRFKGDNNYFDDGWHHRDAVAGKLWSPFGRNVYIPLSRVAVSGTIEKWRSL